MPQLFQRLEPLHGQFTAPGEADFGRPLQVALRKKNVQFVVGDVPGKIDDPLPPAPNPREVVVVDLLLPHPIVPRAVVQVEAQVVRQGRVQRDGPRNAQGRQPQVRDVAALQVRRDVRPDVEVEGREGIVAVGVEDRERRLVRFHALFALLPGFLATTDGLVLFWEEAAEQAAEEGHGGSANWKFYLTPVGLGGAYDYYEGYMLHGIGVVQLQRGSERKCVQRIVHALLAVPWGKLYRYCCFVFYGTACLL